MTTTLTRCRYGDTIIYWTGPARYYATRVGALMTWQAASDTQPNTRWANQPTDLL